eukprot:8206164-Pyramimonas_sp.AAC.1
MIKRICIGRRNTNGWEQGVLEEITCLHLWNFEHVHFKRPDLLGSRTASPKLMDTLEEVFNFADGCETTTAKSVQ